MHEGYKHYYIHSNGDRPYVVYVKDDVYVYKSEDGYDYKKNGVKNLSSYTTLVKHYTPQKIFVGESPSTRMTRFSAGYGPTFTGNTILLHINDYNYVVIHERIEEFTTNNDHILEYISPVGNNDVPYHFAIGEKYLYAWCHPIGYLPLKYFDDITDYDYIQDIAFELAPFFTQFDHMQEFSMTVEEYRIYQNTCIDDISIEVLKELGNMFHVIVDNVETKQGVVDIVKKVRHIDICKI